MTNQRLFAQMMDELEEMPDSVAYFYETMQQAHQAKHPFFRHDNPLKALIGLENESAELREAHEKKDRKEMRNEAGDVLFFLLKYCIEENISFNEVAAVAVRRWLRRQKMLEEAIISEGYSWENVPYDVAGNHWKNVKKQLKQQEHQE